MSDTLPPFGLGGRMPIPPRELLWSSCWVGESPTLEGSVEIGQAVAIDGTAEAGEIAVLNGGVLTLRQGARLRVQTLHVHQGGRFITEAGSEIVFADRPFPVHDPEQWGNGLIVEGEWLARGTLKTPFIRLGSYALPRHVAVQVDGPVEGWLPGDRLALPPSGERDYYHRRRVGDRLRIRPEVSDDPDMVLVDDMMRVYHLIAWPTDEQGTYLPHVANLSRDIILHSESPAGVRGHVVILGHGTCDIEGVEFRDLGRTDALRPIGPDNRKGRYALHLHHLHGGPTPGKEHRFRIVGCSIVDSRKWALAIHDSHCGLVEGNVIVGAQHAGIATEEGPESFNFVVGNFVCDIADGHGIWLAGVNNYINGNVIASCWGDPAKPIVNEFGAEVGGYGIWMVSNTSTATRKYTVPRRDGTTYTFTNGWQGILSCERNECYTVRGGVYLDHRKGHLHAIDRLRVWSSYGNVTHGIAVGVYDTAPQPGSGRGVTIQGLVSRGASVDCYSNNSTRVYSCDIKGCDVGVRDRMNSGMLTIAACTLDNQTDVSVVLPSNAGAGPLPLSGTPVKEVVLTGNAHHGTVRVRGETLWDVNTPSRIPVSLTRITIDGRRAYFREQLPGAICPSILDIPADPIFARNGCPERGLTNAQAWERYRRALGGEVAPADAVAIPGTVGLVAAP